MTESPPKPTFTDFSDSSFTDLYYGDASFLRNASNNNITIIVPEGIQFGQIWQSSGIFLPINTFNSVNNYNTQFATFNQATSQLDVIDNCKINHNISIHFKLTNADDTNYQNIREIRCKFVKANGVTEYGLVDYIVTKSNSIKSLVLNGVTINSPGDVVAVRFDIIQNNPSASSKLTIFKINWNISVMP